MGEKRTAIYDPPRSPRPGVNTSSMTARNLLKEGDVLEVYSDRLDGLEVSSTSEITTFLLILLMLPLFSTPYYSSARSAKCGPQKTLHTMKASKKKLLTRSQEQRGVRLSGVDD